ncbi:MAG: U32 family peptidase, partial [Alistipes sp.]|nr:U32 family peptidase [Alistipes sp.]
MRYIELLSPAKDYDTARAAVDHGADAIYMGAARFGARRAAANSLEDVARTVEYAHQYGVRVHSTLNTVLYDDELADAERMARELIATGIDALIVQDMALREMNLPVELHASTQAGTTTPEQALFLEQSGFSRVILERALTLEDIRRIREATSVELECFVHGAICVGYSGRCFLSRSTSQRSGNRGECSQPCRLPYDLKDSSGRTIMAGKHLLSVRDLDLSEDLEALIDAGISSFKIEGRLKDVRYIKNVVNYYRRQIDEILARRKDIVRPSVGRTITEFEPNPQKSFTRGASQYMLHGKRSGVASFDTPKAVGEYLGRIVSLTRKGFTLSPACDLTAGDGICIISAEGMSGTNINAVEGGNIIPNRMDGIVAGADVYRNYDHRFALAVDRSRTRRTIDATAHLTLA